MNIIKLLIHIRQGPTSHNPSIQHQDVQLPECFNCFFQEGVGVCDEGYIGSDTDGTTLTLGIDRVDDFLGGVTVADIIYYNVCPILTKRNKSV